MERASVIQNVYTLESLKIWNKNLWAVWSKIWIPMVFFRLHRQWHTNGFTSHYSWHKQNYFCCLTFIWASPPPWMDNYYNSPYLAKLLKTNRTDCVGILRLNRKDVLKIIKNAKLKKGEMTAQHSGPVSVMKWQDKKLAMISTYHNLEMITQIKHNKEVNQT